MAQDKNSTPLNIALIGCGKMGGAMLRGWLDSGIANDIHVVDPQDLPGNLESAVIHYRDAAAFAKAAPRADVIVMAVKPQVMDEACAGIADAVTQDTLVLSIAAGKTIESFENHFGADRAIIRAMPNTPAQIGQGITVAVPNGNVSDAQKQAADSLLRAMGAVEWVDDEQLMDAVTALSGSGPAYVFLLIEAMTKAGEKAGLPPDLATKLGRQTVIGAAALAAHDKDTPPEILRKNVTSPGGTTEAALKVLTKDDAMQNLFDQAITAARDRGRELSKPKP